MAPLKVFAFDYATAGGPMTRTLPQPLRRQGAMLLQALLGDLGALPGIELITMAAAGATSRACGTAIQQRPFSESFEACVAAADAVWPLAPESGGLLERLSRDILHGKRVLLGSAPAAIRLAASKRMMARALAGGGVASVATYSPHESLPEGEGEGEGAWVVKPDDGAGCLNTRLFSNRGAALAWIRASAADGYVLQPFVAGRLGSLSLLCCDGVARVLSCNLERVAMRDNQFQYLGSTVNGLDDADGALDRLAQQVAAAIPGLWGYVGVDFILTERGAAAGGPADRGPLVLEVNPRLTAAYAGLHASIGCNPAGLVIELLNGPAGMSSPVSNHSAVSVDVAAFGLP